MVVIDDLGTEKISGWALDKLYTIIENRNENKLSIIITTKNGKEISKMDLRKAIDDMIKNIQLVDGEVKKLEVENILF